MRPSFSCDDGRVITVSGHGPTPSCARLLELNGKTRDFKTGRVGQQVQIRQLLDLAVLLLYTCKMGLPQHLFTMCTLEFLSYRPEGPVQPPGVGTYHLHPLLQEPQGGILHQAAPHIEVFDLSPVLVRTGLQQVMSKGLIVHRYLP